MRPGVSAVTAVRDRADVVWQLEGIENSGKSLWERGTARVLNPYRRLWRNPLHDVRALRHLAPTRPAQRPLFIHRIDHEHAGDYLVLIHAALANQGLTRQTHCRGRCRKL